MILKENPVKKSRGDFIAEQLEEAVLNGNIMAGSRLDEVSIAAQYGVSRTPVREALHILCARGFAEREPYRGVIVTQISVQRIDEMFEAMAELEALCGRLASHRMLMSERAELQNLHNEMNVFATQGNHTAYNEYNTQFHTLIFQGCHNSDLIAASQALRLKLAPFRKYQLKDAGRLMRSCEEHQLIVDAIINQDPKAAETALRRHLLSAAQEILLKRNQAEEDLNIKPDH